MLPINMNYRERGESHARAVHVTQDTSRMKTASMKQEAKRHENNNKLRLWNLEKGKSANKARSVLQFEL